MLSASVLDKQEIHVAKRRLSYNSMSMPRASNESNPVIEDRCAMSVTRPKSQTPQASILNPNDIGVIRGNNFKN